MHSFKQSIRIEEVQVKKMFGLLKSLWEDDSGVTAVEYGLIAGLMAALLVGVMSLFGEQLQRLFTAISDQIGGAADTVSQTQTPN
jgi:pilus assembly protein Flp/PilA